jgi:hypothetical protein
MITLKYVLFCMYKTVHTVVGKVNFFAAIIDAFQPRPQRGWSNLNRPGPARDGGNAGARNFGQAQRAHQV